LGLLVDKVGVLFCLIRGGLVLMGRLLSYARYNLKQKWRFIYFELDLEAGSLSALKVNESIVIRIAEKKDISGIEADIYPFMRPENENDKRYISRIGENSFKCFIAEKEGKIIHYFLVFEKALESPLMQTPFYKEKTCDSDAYLGSAFTLPSARGLWVMPCVLKEIIIFLKNNTNATRVLVLVHEDTVGAVAFFSRLGFSVMNDACPSNPIASLAYKLGILGKK